MRDLMASEVQAILAAAMPGAEVSVRDDTHKHEGHNAEVGHFGSHFLVRVVWAGFAGKARLARHREVFGLFRTAWEGGLIHSLSLRLLTPEEAAA